MRPTFQLSSLIPSGLSVENVARDGDTVVVTARGLAQVAACPLCGTASGRVHSRYERRVSDLPCAGRGVLLRIVARRFLCQAPLQRDNQDDSGASIKVRRCAGRAISRPRARRSTGSPRGATAMLPPRGRGPLDLSRFDPAPSWNQHYPGRATISRRALSSSTASSISWAKSSASPTVTCSRSLVGRSLSP